MVTVDVSEAAYSAAEYTWRISDSIELGKADWMFDDTIMRLDHETYPSASDVNTALAGGEMTCPQGMCICFSKSRNGFFLLCRNDQRDVGLRLFDELKHHYPDRYEEDFPPTKLVVREKGVAPVGRELPQSIPCRPKSTASVAMSLPPSRTVFQRMRETCFLRWSSSYQDIR